MLVEKITLRRARIGGEIDAFPARGQNPATNVSSQLSCDLKRADPAATSPRHCARPLVRAAGSTPSKFISARSSASTNASIMRTGLLSSMKSSRHSGNSDQCRRSAASTKRLINSSRRNRARIIRIPRRFHTARVKRSRSSATNSLSGSAPISIFHRGRALLM